MGEGGWHSMTESPAVSQALYRLLTPVYPRMAGMAVTET